MHIITMPLRASVMRWDSSLIKPTALELTVKEQDMTRKDYQLIAKAIYLTRMCKAVLDGQLDWSQGLLVMELADSLEKDNPRFDRARFITACEVGA